MTTNLVRAFAAFVKKPRTHLTPYYNPNNRMTSLGESFEYYVKNLLCDSFNNKNKPLIHRRRFSYLGSYNNPPDLIYRNGPAFEAKKITCRFASIILNGSYPKGFLFSNNPQLSNECKKCEKWKKKDLYYIIGFVNKNNLQELWCIAGHCIAAKKEVYEKKIEKLSNGLHETKGITFSKTKAFAKIKKIDPLRLTQLRLRPIWSIPNPNNIFKKLKLKSKSKFSFNLILLLKQYLAFSKKDRKKLERLINKNFSISDAKIPFPNNPKKRTQVKVLKFKK